MAASVVRFTVKSSDVLDESRVVVEDAVSGAVLWHKERLLTEHEIVDRVLEAPADATAPPTVRWTIHSPKRGWYLRLQSPSFPPNAFVTLAPPKPDPALAPSEQPPSGTLTFGCQTFALVPAGAPPPFAPGAPASEPASHSYPPKSAHRSSSSSSREPSAHPPPTQISQFVLSPAAPAAAPSTSRFAFLARLAPAPRANTYAAAFTLHLRRPDTPPVLLLTFRDETGLFSVRTQGTLELHAPVEGALGVERSFWIAVALAFLGFLEERDAFLASEESY